MPSLDKVNSLSHRPYLFPSSFSLRTLDRAVVRRGGQRRATDAGRRACARQRCCGWWRYGGGVWLRGRGGRRHICLSGERDPRGQRGHGRGGDAATHLGILRRATRLFGSTEKPNRPNRHRISRFPVLHRSS